MSKILVTGSAGFIGYHLVKSLIKRNHDVIGIDNLNEYYDKKLKTKRLDNLNLLKEDHSYSGSYDFYQLDLIDKNRLEELFSKNKFEIIINLAAQAGVRYSIDNPYSYMESNLVGFMNILECCRSSEIKHLIFASSSSVYGMNMQQPFSVDHNTNFPISLYASTKKSNEVLAFSYSHLYDIPMTGLRFFTVYGPFGRPDMAYFKFTKAINEGKSIDIYNYGKMKRDFTYIDDVVHGILGAINKIPEEQNNNISSSKARFKIYNLGNNKPITLKEFINCIEEALQKKAILNELPMQLGDVPITYADISDAKKELGFNPKTDIKEGISNFVKWYKDFYLD
tara:strand:- start:22539 stop:23552 length:1014 start_codon:yes stop_codon:yes gene_type:complete